MKLPAACMTLLLLAACSAPGGAKTFHAGNVTVIDESGLVTGVESVAPVASTTGEPTVAAGKSLTQVVVNWTGSSCVESWTVRLAGNALEMTIEPGSSADGCAGSPALEAVQLDLNRVVDAPNIDVSLAGG